jgi:hypothetical protein
MLHPVGGFRAAGVDPSPRREIPLPWIASLYLLIDRAWRARSRKRRAGRKGSAAPIPSASPPSAGRVRILFLGANSGGAPLDIEREVSRIQLDLRMARERDALEFRHVGAVTSDTLMQALLDESPTIVHFAGHGGTEGVFLRDEAGEPTLVTGAALASLFALFADTLRCVVLNACWSEAQAHAIRRRVPHVIGTRSEIPDAAALAFSAGFYKAIGAGRDVSFAFEAGRARVHLEGCGGEDLLVLL